MTIKNAFASAGFSSGTKTPLKVCQRLARRVYDASSSDGWIVLIAPSRIINAIGVKASTCANQIPVNPYSQLVLVKPNHSTINSVT